MAKAKRSRTIDDEHIGDDESLVRSLPPPPMPKVRDRWSLLRMTGGVATTLVMSGLLVWSTRNYLLSSPRFAVRSVIVSGNHALGAQRIVDQGGAKVGDNIFRVDTEGVEARLLENRFIATAEVTRKLPTTLEISITEREAAALVPIGDEVYLSTADGDVFKSASTADPWDLPMITGVDPDEVAKDHEGAIAKIRKALAVAEEVGRAGITKIYPLQEIHIRPDSTLVMILGRDGISVHLGDGPYRIKLAELERVLSEAERRKLVPSVIFLDNDAHPESVVVRFR